MDGDPETLKKETLTKYRTQSLAQILKVFIFIPLSNPQLVYILSALLTLCGRLPLSFPSPSVPYLIAPEVDVRVPEDPDLCALFGIFKIVLSFPPTSFMS